MRLYAELIAAHDARVTELLAANNREVERRRLAESRLAEVVARGNGNVKAADTSDFETLAEVMHESSIKLFIAGGHENERVGNLLADLALTLDTICKEDRKKT